MRVCMYVCARARAFVCVYAYVYTYICTYIHIIYMYVLCVIYTYINSLIYNNMFGIFCLPTCSAFLSYNGFNFIHEWLDEDEVINV